MSFSIGLFCAMRQLIIALWIFISMGVENPAFYTPTESGSSLLRKINLVFPFIEEKTFRTKQWNNELRLGAISSPLWNPLATQITHGESKFFLLRKIDI